MYGHTEGPRREESTYFAYVQELSERLEEAYRTVRANLKTAAERRKHLYDLRVKPKVFQEGEWVWYLTPRRYKGRSPKWQRNYTGPFMVVGVKGPTNYLIQRSQRAKAFITHVDKLSRCYGRVNGE